MSIEEDVITGLFGETSDDTNMVSLKYDSYSLDSHFLSSRYPAVRSLQLALLDQHHSLWAEYIYNAARLMTDLMTAEAGEGCEGTGGAGDASACAGAAAGPATAAGAGQGIHSTLCEGLQRIAIQRTDKCLELGAGAGLPGLAAALCGAGEVVISDYGNDHDLALLYAIDCNISRIRDLHPCVLYGVAYTWGYPVDPLVYPSTCYQHPDAEVDLSTFSAYCQSKLLARLQEHQEIQEQDKFTKIFLADLIFNRSEHRKLLWTVKACLHKEGVCYVTFSHHDPLKAALDLAFFQLAEEDGFMVTAMGKVNRLTYPFREADGLDEQRGDVFFYTLTLM